MTDIRMFRTVTGEDVIGEYIETNDKVISSISTQSFEPMVSINTVILENTRNNSNNSSNPNDKSSSIWKYYLKGALSGMTGILLSHPLDTIKTHIQTGNALKDFKPRNFYKGLMAPMLGVGLEKAIVFWLYFSKCLLISPAKPTFEYFDCTRCMLANAVSNVSLVRSNTLLSCHQLIVQCPQSSNF